MPDFFENDSNDRLKKEAEKRSTHSLWCEKYRPLKLDDFIGSELVKQKAQSYIAANDIPHMLLHATPGTGKTTLSKILMNTINCDSMYINASMENSVESVRQRIEGFASSMGFKPLKIVVLDEADFLTPNAQAALRNLMETYSQSTRFILTCNAVERIVPAIASRCQVFHLIPPSKKEIAGHVYRILGKENVEANGNDLALIINSMYPDIRRIINTLQLMTVDGKLVVNQQEMIDADYKLKVLDILKDKRIDKKTSFKDVRQILANNSISDFTDMYKLLYDKIDDYAAGHLAPVILILSDMDSKYVIAVDKELNFMACIIQVLDLIKA